MKRRDVLQTLAGLMAAPVLGGLARGSQKSSDDVSLPDLFRAAGPMMEKIPIKVEPLAPGLTLISGPGGNIAVLVGPDGVLVVDAFVPARGADLIAEIRKLSPGPIITLINTHWHFDHTGGNAALAGAGATIVAHVNTRKRLGADQYIADFELNVPAAPAVARPTLSFEKALTVSRDGEEIHCAHVPPAHTDGDIFIHFRKANILHTGDLFTNGSYPNIDSSTGGWIGGMIAAADVILGIVDAKTKIIPGHGPIGTRDDLKASRDMLAEARARVEPLVEAGKTLEETIAARPLAALDARWGKGFFRASHFTRVVYSGLVQHRAAKAKSS